VIEAASDADALAAIAEHDAIRVLLTDIVMPGIDGIGLAQQLRALQPALGVIYMSGYTEHPMLGPDRLGADELFLQKPFSPETLSTMLRKACDGRAPASHRARS
jgi:two-component system, cell cycle sensor histidine kinase and response regulator CckA